MELTNEMQEVDGSELLKVLEGVLSGGWPRAEASLKLEYTRKGCPVSGSVWPEYDAGNRDHGSVDEYVLKVEVRVPKDYGQIDFTEMVGDSVQALRKGKADELERKRAVLQTDLDRVQNEIAGLGQG